MKIEGYLVCVTNGPKILCKNPYDVISAIKSHELESGGYYIEKTVIIDIDSVIDEIKMDLKIKECNKCHKYYKEYDECRTSTPYEYYDECRTKTFN